MHAAAQEEIPVNYVKLSNQPNPDGLDKLRHLSRHHLHEVPLRPKKAVASD